MRGMYGALAFLIAVGCCGEVAGGAQAAPAQIPAGSMQDPQENDAILNEGIAEDVIPAVSPDTHSLSGGLARGIGSWGPRHSFVVPGWNVAEVLDSNPSMQSPGTYRGFTSGAAQLQAVQYLGRSGELRYIGAVRADSSARIYGANRVSNVHGLEINKVWSVGGWNVVLDNQATYSQGALFGDAGMEGLGPVVTEMSKWDGAFGIQLGSLSMQTGLTPEQSILTLQSGRLSETALSEVDRRIGSRTVATGAAYYGLLHFFSGDLIDGWQKGIIAGFDRQVTARDRIGMGYAFTRLGFSGTGYGLSANSGMLLYGRQLSGKLAAEAGIGPESIQSVGRGTDFADLDWQGRGSVMLHLRALDVGLGAKRMLTIGSGVLYGAHTSSVEGSAGHRFGRSYSASVNFGVAHNSSIGTGDQYATQFFGATFSHRVTSQANGFFSYTLQRQTGEGYSAATCGETGLRQVFGAGISWTSRPIGVR